MGWLRFFFENIIFQYHRLFYSTSTYREFTCISLECRYYDGIEYSKKYRVQSKNSNNLFKFYLKLIFPVCIHYYFLLEVLSRCSTGNYDIKFPRTLHFISSFAANLMNNILRVRLPWAKRTSLAWNGSHLSDLPLQRFALVSLHHRRKRKDLAV